jgi:cell wall-associated NlpC family hydrolase
MTIAGGVLMYSGIQNVTIQNVLGSLAKGTVPPKGPAEQFATVPASAPTAPGAVGTTNSAIANTALKYVGNRYVWGGAPGTAKGVDAGTDCSGFVNMVVGRDLGMAVPGYAAGQYNGSTHGAPTGGWLIWGGVTGIAQSQMQPGDLVVWQTHMGIWIGNGQMVSALDTQDGVKVTSLADGSPTGEVLFPKRLTGLSGTLPTGTGNAPATLLEP